MLSADLVLKHVRRVQYVPESKHWFPAYESRESFVARVEEQHWLTRSVNETWNSLTREALELLASDAAVETVGGVFVFSDEGKLFTGFRRKDGGSEVLVLNLRSLQDELDTLQPPSKWCVIS